ncbi:G-type lectin S-receptor-like serine/threonine-protein [Vigna angularis]|uniref:G-type lectin S-receptor-like serine/threonine-protein n=1 Tax=Phaseolus angularis TaxID=3914 RepID=A0A8T0KLC1_PHAAN|nr:G-type lectin S-receptor-like serine/threonine-protein [Vigna angularis]
MKPILTLSCILFFCTTISAHTFSYITPNFSASYLHFIDDFGTFLVSPNNTFKAAIFNPGGQQTSFYLCVIHDASKTIIWSANRDAPISDSGKMLLTVKGITIIDHDGNTKWSTPSLKSQANRLVLTEMGNLVLQDTSNGSLWESFQSPTDTIVIGQRLPVGASLSSAASNSNLSTGDFKLTISSSDAVLQWYGQTYWKLSTDTKVFKNSNNMVEYMAVNNSGFYLFGDGGTAFQLGLPLANFRIATLGSSGKFTINSFSNAILTQEFVGPGDGCQTPLACGRAGLCTKSTDSSSPVCSCPPNFRVGSGTSGGCVLSNGSHSLSLACENSSVVSFSNIGYVQYFGTFYSDPVMYKGDLSSCQKFCSNNCSCLGILYKNTSGSCYTIENELGSIQASNGDNRDMLGFIKTNVVESKTGTNDDSGNKQSSQNGGFPVAVAVVLPIIGFIILMAIIFLGWRRLILLSKIKEVKLGKNSPSSGDLDAFYIPGLPARSRSHSMDESNSGGGHSSTSSTTGLVYFPLFALEMHEQKSYLELADPRLEGRVTYEELEKVIRIALCCVHEEPVLRPNMVTVVGMLEGGTPLPHPRIESLNFLRFYGRRFTEASTIAEENEYGSLMHQEARRSTSIPSDSPSHGFSYMSSQNISGPR